MLWLKILKTYLSETDCAGWDMLYDCRMIDQLKYGELARGSRKTGRPLLRNKDTIKDILNRGGALHTWRDAVMERTEWRKCIHDISRKIDTERKEENKRRRVKRHEKRTRGRNSKNQGTVCS